MPETVLTEDNLHTAIFVNMTEHDELVKALIGVELKTVLPVFLAHVNEKASAFRDAIAALEKPAKALAEIEQQITAAEGKCSQISLQLAIDDVEERARTRMRFNEWDAELTALSKRRDWLESELAGLQHERNIAEELADKALGGLLNLASAIADPFTHPMGQGTAGYIRFRMPQTWQLIVAGERDHPEYELALVQLRQVARIAGYKLVEDDFGATARMWDAYTDAKREEQTLQPSGADVTTATLTTIDRVMADAKANEKIEDLRGHRTVAHATRLPDPAMAYQRLRDIQTSGR